MCGGKKDSGSQMCSQSSHATAGSGSPYNQTRGCATWPHRRQTDDCSQGVSCHFDASYYGLILAFFRLLQNLLEFAYSGKTKLEDAALIPAVSLADKVGLKAFVDNSVPHIVDK